MATTVANLAVSVTARTERFQQGMVRSARSLQRFQQKTQTVKLALKGLATRLLAVGGAAGGAFLVGRSFTRLVRSTEEFNQALRGSLAIMGQVSEVMRRDLSDAAIEMARVTKFSATEAAGAYFFLASAGLSAVQSIKALPLVTKFAQAGLFDLSLATDLLTDAQSALGQSVDDATLNLQKMTRIADVLVKANTLANASVQQFSEALTNKAGAALKILNKDVEEGVAVLAAFADQGVKSSDAGTALNIVLRDLSTKAIRNEKAFRDMNVRVFDLNDNMRNIADIIGDVERALDGMSDKTKKATLLQLGFSDKSVIFIQTLIGLSEKIRGYEAALRDAGGTTENIAAKQLTPLQKGMADLGATFSDIGRRAGFINSAIGGLAKSLSALIRLPTAAGERLGELLSPLLGGTSLAEFNEAESRLKALQGRLAVSNEARDRRQAAARKRVENQLQLDAEARRRNRALGRMVRQPGGGIALEPPRVLQSQQAFDAAMRNQNRMIRNNLSEQRAALAEQKRAASKAEAAAKRAAASQFGRRPQRGPTSFLQGSLLTTSFGGLNRGQRSQDVQDKSVLTELKTQTVIMRQAGVATPGLTVA